MSGPPVVAAMSLALDDTAFPSVHFITKMAAATDATAKTASSMRVAPELMSNFLIGTTFEAGGYSNSIGSIFR
jgi:hypothetical protein